MKNTQKEIYAVAKNKSDIYLNALSQDKTRQTLKTQSAWLLVRDSTN